MSDGCPTGSDWRKGGVRRMQASIKASCPSCGDVELTVGELTVRVCSADDRSAYRFRCPGCTKVVFKDTNRRVADLLVSSGVELDVWDLPSELAERPNIEFPISEREIRGFREALDEGGWFAELVGD